MSEPDRGAKQPGSSTGTLRPASEQPASAVDVARAALAGREAWLVGGVVRDRLLGLQSTDVDVVVAGDPAQAARAVARAAPGRAACFALSEEFGSWRVLAAGHAWQVDVEPLRGETLEQDLALRDFTINAIAEPLGGGAPIDPLGGLADLRARRLRMAGGDAFAADPLRILRLVRVAVELGLAPQAQTAARARDAVEGLREVAAERIFAELRRILAAPHARRGIELLGELGAATVVLPELEALRGVEQSRFHHTDVYGHTLEVLDWAVTLTSRAPSPELELALGDRAAQVHALLAEPLADELSRGDALRWGALMHDWAKPPTRAVGADGRVTFIGHDARGAQLAREALTRLRTSERLRAHLAALVRNHLRLGFLVHEPQPLSRRTVFAYMHACTPVQVDVTLLSVADRLATRGASSEEAIAAHLLLARGLLVDALRWRADGPPQPLLRGDELASELGIATGPRVGELLEALSEARYAGEVRTREEALSYARALLARV